MKNCIKIIVFVLLGVLMVCPFTFADDATLEKVNTAVEKNNAKVNDMIDKAVVVADILVKNNVSPDVIIGTLIDRAEQLTAVTIKNAAKDSVTVICEYVEVQIGGETVLVDPSRVINY